MSNGRRLAIFGALVAVCVIGAAAAIAVGINKQQPRVAASDAARRLLGDAREEGRPMLLIRSLAPKGQLAVAPLEGSEPGKRTFEPLSCDRSYFAAGRGICLQHSKTFPNGLTAKLFGSDFRVTHSVGLTGIPSRTRVSPDGRYGAATAFVAGDSYAAAGSFSTRTTLIDMAAGTKIADLEDFTVTRGERQVTAIDVNFWGVTFDPNDSDRFYATLATGGKTYLLRGSVSSRTAHAIHDNVECPSVSPDGKLIAYKKRTGPSSAPWRLTVLDLATMRETPLAETRSVDDQVEWLDGHTILYGIDNALWAVPADGSGKPRRYLAAADSPATVR
jgi:Tol biopolymer transport system component